MKTPSAQRFPRSALSLLLAAALPAAALICAAALPSCASPAKALPPPVPGDADRAALASLEERLVKAEISIGSSEAPSGDAERREQRELVGSIARPLSSLASRPWADLGFRLDCLALSGEAALVQGDALAARRFLSEADELSSYGLMPGADDPAPLLRARLIPDAAQRLAFLRASADQRFWSGQAPGRVSCELGILAASLGLRDEAEEAFSRGLERLRPALRDLYRPVAAALLEE